MEEFTPLQQRLMRLRDERCGGNAAELARRIKKDATYVNRLFYPAEKPGAKGIGLEIMAACNEAFGLPAGYWEGVLAYWPFSEELQQFVAGLDAREIVRLENVIRAHLGLGQLLTSVNEFREPDVNAGTLLLSSAQNETAGSAGRSGLSVVKPVDSPVTPTPALDAEDARHRRPKNDRSRDRAPSRSKTQGHPR